MYKIILNVIIINILCFINKFNAFCRSNEIKIQITKEQDEIINAFIDIEADKINEIVTIVKNIIQLVKSKTFYGVTNKDILVSKTNKLIYDRISVFIMKHS